MTKEDENAIVQNLTEWLTFRGCNKQLARKAVLYFIHMIIPDLDEAAASDIAAVVHLDEVDGRKFVRIKIQKPCNKIG